MADHSMVGVVGGGIIGLAVARELAATRGARVIVLEKEYALARHQTGHNSGVVHAGIYYPPGSLKATLCRQGAALLREFCAVHGLPYRELGKVVVAIRKDELPRLAAIEERAVANRVPGLRRLVPAELCQVEPHVEGLAALHSPHTAVVDFTAVADRLAYDIQEFGGEVLLGRRVTSIRQTGFGVDVTAVSPAGSLDGVLPSQLPGPGADTERFRFDSLIVCAGLGTDAVARAAGLAGDVRIVPFRGEYHRLRDSVRHLVRGLVYPVPDPRYPFLGVHFTRRFDDQVLVGPNAIMALAREGYRWRDVSWRDVSDVAGWPGFWSLAAAHWRAGARELLGSLSKRAFAATARRYVPELTVDDLRPAPAGVRAQAVDREGNLVDDFRIQVSDRVVIIRNAPSPAATSSLAIAQHIARQSPTV